MSPDIPFEEFLQRALHHYMAAAVRYSAVGDDEQPLGQQDTDGWTEEALARSRMDLAEFIALAATDLGDMSPSEVGRDFWLTRNWHGIGFWDRGLGDRGDRLTKLAEKFPEVSGYVTDNNKMDLA